MKVGNVMTQDLVTIDVDQNFRDAKRLMEKHDVSRLLVTDEGKVVGILTERDMARRLGSYVERRLSDAHIHVSAEYTRNLITISEEASIKDAARLMLKHGISSLVVTRNSQIVGIVTKTDLITTLKNSRAKVKHHMSSPVMTVPLGEDLLRVRRLMLKHKVKRILVQIDGKVVGIVTEGDVARALGLFRKISEERHWDERLKQIKVEDVMSRDVLRVEVNDTLGKCTKLMLTYDISGLPVVENERLVGIITKTDLIKAIGAT